MCESGRAAGALAREQLGTRRALGLPMSAVPTLHRTHAATPAAASVPRFLPRIAPAPISLLDVRSTELMRRYQSSRDADAFGDLYELNRPRIERLVKSCLRYGAPDLDEQEIVQDVFVSVVRSAHAFRPDREGSFRHWTAQIARNAVRRALRDRRRQQIEKVIPLPETLAMPAHRAVDLEPLNGWIEALPVVLAAFSCALVQLGARDREVLLATEVEQIPYADLARQRGLRSGTVRMVVFRARRRLLEHVEAALNCAR